jgi:hypothetical protein
LRQIKLVTYLPNSTGNATGGVGVAHVVHVAEKLQFVVQSSGHGVQTVSDQSDLVLVIGIAGQSIGSDTGELGEEFLDAGSFLEEPFFNSNIDLILEIFDWILNQ